MTTRERLALLSHEELLDTAEELVEVANDLFRACVHAEQNLFVAVKYNVRVKGFDASQHTTIKQLRAAIIRATGGET